MKNNAESMLPRSSAAASTLSDEKRHRELLEEIRRVCQLDYERGGVSERVLRLIDRSNSR